MNGLDLTAAVAVAGACYGAYLTRKTLRDARRRTGGLPAPGDGHPPGAGERRPPGVCTTARPADPRPSPAPALTPRHGGRVKTIDVWADGRMTVFDRRTGECRVVPGDCPGCTAAIEAAIEELLP